MAETEEIALFLPGGLRRIRVAPLAGYTDSGGRDERVVSVIETTPAAGHDDAISCPALLSFLLPRRFILLPPGFQRERMEL
jgi:hypothetical protein